MEFILGFMTAAWLLTLAGVGYALWRYSYRAAEQLRVDFRKALTEMETFLHKEIEDTRDALKGTNEAVIALDNKVGLVQSLSRSDEEQAEMERRWRARQNIGSAGGFGRAA